MKKTTAERLKQIMKEENLKQVDILERSKKFCEIYGTKLTKTDLSQYVSGKVEPGQDKLCILALSLNVNEVWLMGFEVSKEPFHETDSAIQETTINVIETDKITNLLAKRKDITALINFIGENEEKISPEDIEKTMNMIEMFFVNK
jgi:transcriptional regulator with XRE-family HTH domain